MNVHNCLVDSSTCSNVISYDMYKKVNVEPQNINTQIIQLDQTRVKRMRELKEVVIRLSSNPKVFRVTYIIAIGILEAYGLLLIRVWSSKLNG